jgi:Cft2 family RNA processing exonuclease
MKKQENRIIKILHKTLEIDIAFLIAVFYAGVILGIIICNLIK